MTIPAGTLVPRDARDFGNYQLLAKLATGGMAEIFLARPTGAVKTDVLVLKRILPHLAEDEHFVTMFRDEADLASKLLHKNVCQVMSFGQFAGTWYIAMEYLHGVPLSRMMTRLSKAGKMLDFRVVAGIIVQACEGLHSAHDATDGTGALLGVVHRDVSPPNIMVCAEGTVKLLDFGIAKARGANSRTRTGTVKGKNAYMSPEQILGKPLDRRSDVFALAVVMYEMLSIKRLFHRDSDFLTFKAITEEPIPDIRERRPDLPAGMRAALIQAMARDPAGRWESAQAFGNAIRASVAHLGGPAAPSDLARLLGTDFADEMSARDEILKAADDPNLAPATSPTGQIPKRPPPLPPARPQSRSGELGGNSPTPLINRAVPMPGVPSMVVNPGTGKIAMPQTPPPLTPAQATPAPTPPSQPLIPQYQAASPSGPTPTPLHTPAMMASVPDLSASMPVDNWMADPDTDLLKAHRMRSVRNLIIACVAIAIIAIGLIYVLSMKSGEGDDDRPVAGTKADAGRVYVPPPPDAATEMSHDQIIALSRKGFYSLKSSEVVQVYVDDGSGFHYVGDTPVIQLPLKPGPYKVRVVGKNKSAMTRELKMTIIGGRDTDDGTLTWDAPKPPP